MDDPFETTHNETNARRGFCPLGLGMEDRESQIPCEKSGKNFEWRAVSLPPEQARSLCFLQGGHCDGTMR